MTLKWYFGPSGSDSQGPADSITTTFKGNKYYSLAREVIQNSLDAVLDPEKPVKVGFSLFELERNSVPGLFDLKGSIERCRDNFLDVPAFTKFCDRAVTLLDQDSLTSLRIADFNTKGLEYGGGKTPFYAFMQAVGYTLKSSPGAGGSFGFGKGAYYAASALRTLIVSSIYGDDQFVFQGKARLTTHFDEERTKKDYIGLFGMHGDAPVEVRNGVPPELTRKERGTDVVLVGFDDNEHTWRDSLIKSVLNNFWLAIWDEELVVEIDNTTINKTSLETTIETYFTESATDGRVNEPETWNAYPYFKAVKFKDGPNNHYFERELPTLGLVKLYLFVKEGLPNRTIYMRSPKMTVYKKTNNRGSNYVGVFVCDNPEGNAILREMENPEHNEWKKYNYLDGDKPHILAVRAEGEIRSFISECLDKLQKKHAGAKQKIMGLDQYLTIPEDLLPDEEGAGQDGSSGTEVADEQRDEETAVESAIVVSEPTSISLRAKKKVAVAQTSTGATEDCDEPILTSPSGGSGGGADPGPNPGPHSTPGTSNGEEQIKKPLRLRYRVVAQKSNLGEIVHMVKLFADVSATAELEFLAGVDNDARGDDTLTIKAAYFGGEPMTFFNNKASGIPLVEGENQLNIVFDSDQKHSLKIRSYEI